MARSDLRSLSVHATLLPIIRASHVELAKAPAISRPAIWARPDLAGQSRHGLARCWTAVRVGAHKLGKALQFPGTRLSDRVVELGPFSCKLAKGDYLRIVDV
jgi:hypothetical protein